MVTSPVYQQQNQVLPNLLSPNFYYDADILEKEKQQIFYKNWHFVGQVREIKNPGQYFTCKILGQSIIVIRDLNNRIRAYYNVCPHRGHELLQGKGQTQKIVCPYHAWIFKTNGQLHRASFAHEMSEFDNDAFEIKAIAIEEICGLLFINFDTDTQSLKVLIPEFENQLQNYIPKIANLQRAYRQEFTVACNWKNLIENALEDYHTLSTHPGLKNNVTTNSFYSVTKGMTSYQVYQPQRDLEGRYHLQDTTNFTWWWLWVWPNMQISTFPENGMRISRVYPINATTSQWIFEFYLTQSTPLEAEMENIERLVKTTLPEDINAVESVQRGQQCLGFQQGHLMCSSDPTQHWSEFGIHHFQTLVKQALLSI